MTYFMFVLLLDITLHVLLFFCSAQANIGGDDVYSFDERRIYNDQDLSDLVSIACEVLGTCFNCYF